MDGQLRHARAVAPDGERYSWWHEHEKAFVVVRRDWDDVRVLWPEERITGLPSAPMDWIAFGAGYLSGLEARLGRKLGPGSVVVFDRGE